MNFFNSHIISINIIKFYFLTAVFDSAIAEAVGSRLPTAVTLVRAQFGSCGVCGKQSGSRASFLQLLRFPMPILIPLTSPHSSIIRGQYNRPKSSPAFCGYIHYWTTSWASSFQSKPSRLTSLRSTIILLLKSAKSQDSNGNVNSFSCSHELQISFGKLCRESLHFGEVHLSESQYQPKKDFYMCNLYFIFKNSLYILIILSSPF
jgi:hypothetical protein